MDFSKTDDLVLELATILDEVSAVQSKRISIEAKELSVVKPIHTLLKELTIPQHKNYSYSTGEAPKELSMITPGNKHPKEIVTPPSMAKNIVDMETIRRVSGIGLRFSQDVDAAKSGQISGLNHKPAKDLEEIIEKNKPREEVVYTMFEEVSTIGTHKCETTGERVPSIFDSEPDGKSQVSEGKIRSFGDQFPSHEDQTKEESLKESPSDIESLDLSTSDEDEFSINIAIQTDSFLSEKSSQVEKTPSFDQATQTEKTSGCVGLKGFCNKMFKRKHKK